MTNKIISCILALSLIFSLAACSGGESKDKANNEARDEVNDESKAVSSAEDEKPVEPAYKEEGSWAIYWYLCGSDLESENGFATTDLTELIQVSLPENIKVIIQTGGSSTWHNDVVDPSKLQRFVFDNEGLKLVDEQPLASMGDKQTLYDFLAFAKSTYSADKTAVLFWNHGGGSVSGAEFDELYGNDSLTLDEIYEAFTAVWDVSEENPPLEMVGFDTCLMATIDVAAAFSGIARYLVASQELEPANGWNYSGGLASLLPTPI